MKNEILAILDIEMKASGLMGYLHPDYIYSLSEFGTPIELPESGGWILKRKIPGTQYYDAMGSYPIFSCLDWTQLRYDIEKLSGKLISLSLVVDPFGDYTIDILRKCFPDVVKQYKKHYIIDLKQPMNDFISPHHMRYARKALEDIEVEVCPEPSAYVDDWVALYSKLIEKNNIRGLRKFSRESFIRQLKVPGISLFRAIKNGESVGMTLWYTQDNIAYYHLGASSLLGYELRASFGLFWRAIEYFSDKVRWLNLGAGAGVKSDGSDGLTRFKRGWSTGSREAYFCGVILDHDRYSEIVKTKIKNTSDYFPLYREGEYD